MTNLQKIKVRLSEVRERLNEIAGLDDALTDEIRGESETLHTEYRDLEVRFRAATIAEAEAEAAALGEFGNGDGQSAEVRGILREVSLDDYLKAAAAGVGLTGAPVELAAALDAPAVGSSGGVAIPWEVLAVSESESRALTDTGDLAGGIVQRPILQRLFGVGILDALGVRLESVPAGRSEWPLLTSGVAPVHKAEGTAAAAAVEATFSTEVLKPKKLTGVYSYSHELAAQVPELESALRRDLGDAVKAKMSDQILNGNETSNAFEVNGFLTKIAAPDAPTAVATFSDYAGAPALAVDGIHAAMETQVAVVLGVDSYQHAASVFQSGSGEAASEAIKRRSLSCAASSFLPAKSATKIQSSLLHAAGPNGGEARGDSVAALWPSLEVIRDPYSKASTGIVLTWITLWDFKAAIRSSAYKRIAFKLA